MRLAENEEVKFEALVELSREAESTIHRSLLRNISKVCFGVHTRESAVRLIFKNENGG
ncbi:MAG TPA: hypothetical protein VF347_03740 [Candidatus Humimicrobiaceae bacterium]